MNSPVLTIVVPCYNEEEVLQETTKQLSEMITLLIKEKLVAEKSKILYVDDGSRDRTWPIIEELNGVHPYVTGLKLAHNVGHQKALLAGLEIAGKNSDCVISIDADLQDDISIIKDFVSKYHEGYEIVYGVRKNRDSDTLFKRATAQGFYRFMQKMGVKVVYNHADYRLMSKRALEELSRYKEQNLFLRGVVSLIGFKSTEVYYNRKERFAGESKYPLKKMLSFAFDGITSFSVAPIRFITLIGFLSFLISSFVGIYALIIKLIGHANTGWTSIIVSIWFLGGLLLMSVGLIGEYIGKIYEETKQRPRYAIESDLYTNEMAQNDVSKRFNMIRGKKG
ncbi:glycosyltransferase family 2 protein [Bacillus sp. FJAT-49736]|uniref:glycosyltransferase family 2 protein n=1 Tax=Bacillus sp. FJAT-49736 TaxID=2833582 RepID=UPI001BC9A602|nr:glycosyltransferase family 2 protein [Bacillus sp. FJAT-49736]MBS4174082.1 glycosyltransferase family 2 protein [Bacillus sp. FJAT-49736]